jgi:hypothetical protein
MPSRPLPSQTTPAPTRVTVQTMREHFDCFHVHFIYSVARTQNKAANTFWVCDLVVGKCWQNAPGDISWEVNCHQVTADENFRRLSCPSDGRHKVNAGRYWCYCTNTLHFRESVFSGWSWLIHNLDPGSEFIIIPVRGGLDV